MCGKSLFLFLAPLFLTSCLDSSYELQVANGSAGKCYTETHCGDGICDKVCGEHEAGEQGCAEDCCWCGDGNCNEELCGEGWWDGLYTCSSDCAECGNNTCDPGEGPYICAADCCGGCGDGKCRGEMCDEDPISCPQDCEKFACGNGICEPTENPLICVQDCEPFACGNGTCEPGESPYTCTDDCETGCGDCICDGNESFDTCVVDCGFCGDGYCIAECPHFPESPEVCSSDCCIPTCAGKECGSNGCDGSCGDCPIGKSCSKSGLCQTCVPDCTGKKCGPDGCGSLCGLCPEDHFCNMTSRCECIPQCAGRECGDDGCGNLCGQCNPESKCVASHCQCVPDCSEKECGSDGCGDKCGSCEPPKYCLHDLCECEPDCEGKSCGPDGCGGICGICGPGTTCTSDGTCVCFPACQENDCGDDGCGGTCGSCQEPASCIDGLCVCQTDCDDKECGPDGCSGLCGECDGSQSLCTSEGLCFCISDCAGKMCGDDGCGSECGTCQGLAQCLQGFCVCQPTCYYKLCGSDGCGGSCGECPAESSCENGACIDLDGNCSDGNSLDWDGCTSSSVAEFRVNDNLEQDQASPAVVSIPAGDPLLGDGGFAIAWDGNGLADTNGIYIRIFDQSGVPITTGKLVNESISNAQSDATLAKLADSSLMLVAWNSYTGVDNSFEVMGRVLDLSGAPHADEFVINQHSSGAQETPAVTGLNNGNLAAAWSGAGAGDDSGIYLRVFKPDGSALTDDIQVNEWPSGTQAEADLATLADGNIVVTWTSEGNDNDKNGIAMRMFAPDGSPLDAESPVDITQANSQDRPAITALGGGGFIIAWDSIVAINFREVVAQRYGGPPDYGMEGGEIAINKHVANAQSASDVAPHVGDGYVVFWESLSQDGDTGSGIFGNWFLDTNQHIFNDDQHANSYVDGIQQSVAIAAGQDDTLIVVWQSETTDSDIDVFAQRYKSDGARMYR